ncbi:hypothetical protein DWX94_08575 [Coprococcus eutactus]|uniref:Calcineurin-like phosphoesterase domain-containing protein n=1 Tax=Coprococcus eutactus TaxID=33043 RepID=A0A3R5WL76_9FIRM|nr:hypothetical protein DWX94_08575 [Coprococcus eutactus]
MMWAFIFIFMFAAFIAACIYLITRVRKIALVDKLAKDRKWLSILISALTCVVFIVVLSLAMGYINAIIVTIYMILFWLVCEFAFWLVGKVKNRMKSTAGETTESNIIKNNAESRVKPKKRKIYYAGVTAIIITIVYMSWGWYQAHNVWQKDYTIHTDKAVGSIKLALIADSHTGTTFDGEGFAEHVKAIQAQDPDAVLIAGDFVDDDTSLIDMKKCCEALGTLDTKYGVYYVFGNHDKGYYASERRGYDGDDIIAELEKNGVAVLQDETVLLGDSFYIIGRQDLSEVTDRGGSRADIEDLVKDLDDDKYQIVMDHQPADYANEKASGVDLVLSGHTHGGQLFLIKLFQEITGMGGNDQIYGLENIDGSDFIVTSGISDWAIKFKTGCRSEYVIIDIQGK